MKILITDGFHEKGKWLLEQEGHQVDHLHVGENLYTRLINYDGIIIRSATVVDRRLMDACPDLRFVGRGGVGLDNIDMPYASERGIEVFNTPAASSRSVAELVLAHMLNIARGVHRANREMPEQGKDDFKQLKKSYSKGIELEGKNLGIIGLGRIGTEVAKIGLGLGMNILPHDPNVSERKLDLQFNGQKISTTLRVIDLETVLIKSDIITLHIPNQEMAALGEKEISMMKDGVILINASRGGLIDESALLHGLGTGKVLGAGLDVFRDEPHPRSEILNHPLISMSPHIGASTSKAQEKIAVELARKIIEFADGNNLKTA